MCPARAVVRRFTSFRANFELHKNSNAIIQRSTLNAPTHHDGGVPLLLSRTKHRVPPRGTTPTVSRELMSRSAEWKRGVYIETQWYTAWVENNVTDVTGKTAIVTGANSGIGFYVAMALAGKGCRVILACRNLEKGAAARNEILQENAGAEVYVVFLDLLDLDSVRAFSDYVMDQFDSLHYLINNAGVMALPPGISSDGYEVQLQTNHLGHFLLTKLLWKRLVETEGMSRVVQSSCMAHWVQNPVFNSDKYPDSKSSLLGLLQRIPPGLGHDPADQWLRYGVTKLANLLFMRELHRKIDEKKLSDKIISVAAHGGLAATSLQVSSQHYLPFSWRRQLERNGQSAADASLPLLMAIVSKDVLNGDFLGPSGEGEFTGVPTKVELKGFADNEDQAEDLWDHSEDCVKEVFNI